MDSGSNPFSANPRAYARSRPSYPSELFDWIADQCPGRQTAWDCATGNGQAALALAERFGRVEATDVSAGQLEAAFPRPNVVYSRQPAERTNFEDSSFDLVAVAQALHWFDFDLFWPEVKRVAKPGAFFCAWGYAWFAPDADADPVLVRPLRALLEPFFAPENRLLWDGYRDADILFPFERVPALAFSLRVDWSVDQLIAYVRTWSAYARAAADEGRRRELERIEQAARERLADRRLALEMPLAIVAGTVR